MVLIFAYAAGLLTLINPCILPVLPIVLASALNTDRRGPMMLALGMSVSFVGFGMFVATAGHAIGLTADVLARVGAALMIAFGIVLLTPALSGRFELALAGVSSRADTAISRTDNGQLGGQFLSGLLLGAVWSPCIGPTLGGAIALASQGESLMRAFLIMCFFAAGVSTVILALGLSGRHLMRDRTHALRGLAERSRGILGAVFVAVGLALFFQLHHVIEAWAIRTLPTWFIDLSVSI
jgi:cytochrome c biogenesis protein CcdA